MGATQPQQENDPSCVAATRDESAFDHVLAKLGHSAAECPPGRRTLAVCCPAHDDHNPSLSVTETEDGMVLLKCHAGCTQEDVVNGAGLSMRDLFPASRQLSAGSGLTLAELAAAKALPLEYLQRELHWTDAEYRGQPAIEIPYPTRNGEYGRTRYRIALDDDRFRWGSKKGPPLACYEPDRGARAQEEGRLIVVEGETDTAVCSLHQLPVLGVPGASFAKLIEKAHLAGVDVVYYVREPDKGGDTLSASLPARLRQLGYSGELREISLDGCKDLAELYQERPEHFRDEVRAAIDASVRIDDEGDDDTVSSRKDKIIFRSLEQGVETAIDLLSMCEVYQSAGALVEIVHDPAATSSGTPTPRIHAITEAVLRLRLAEQSIWFQETPEGLHQIEIPGYVVKAVHQLGQWSGVRPLLGFSGLPIIHPDGTLFTQRGYDAVTRLYYEPELSLDVPSRPTDDNVVAARELLLGMVADFPFEQPAQAAAAVAAMLSLVARPAIDGPIPSLLIDANARGAGKTLLARVIGEVAIGRNIATRVVPKTDAEWQKTMLTLAMSGERFVLFDNLKGSLSSDALEAAVTSGVFGGRVLGSMHDVRVPWRAQVVITANNAGMSNDMVRRSLYVRLSTDHERPELRSDFRHPSLLSYVRSNRRHLLRALYVVLLNYFVARRPDLQLDPFGGFDAWSDLVRSAMIYAGFADPVHSQLSMRSHVDDETDLARELLTRWHACFGSRYLTPAEALSEARVDSSDAGALMRESLTAFASDDDQLPSPRQLGNSLKSMRDRVVSGLRLESRAERSSKGKQMRVVSVTPPTPTESGAATADSPDRLAHGGPVEAVTAVQMRDGSKIENDNACSQGVFQVSSTVPAHRDRYRRNRSGLPNRACSVCGATPDGDAALPGDWRIGLRASVWHFVCSEDCRLRLADSRSSEEKSRG